MRNETDSQLVLRVRQGDLSAFEQIVDRYRATLVAVAASRLGSWDDAEDVAQEAFVQGFFQLHQLRDPAALLPWLRRVADRLALMRLREHREDPVEPELMEQLRDVCKQEEPTKKRDTFDLLSALPTAMRETVTLTYLAGYTCGETASLLGIKEGTVKSRLNRARALLREEFKMTEKELAKGKPTEGFTQETIERLMREARRLLTKGDIDGAAKLADEVIGIQIKELFSSGDDPNYKFNEEAAHITSLPFKERRRKDCEANAAQYGFRLEELDWEVADVDMMSGTLGKPTGYGQDIWGVPHSRMKIKIRNARDICRRFDCSPMTLFDWVQKGCPILRCWPFARYDLDKVKEWIKANGVKDWPKESPHDTDRPIRIIFKALHRGELTPGKAEQIITELGWGVGGLGVRKHLLI